MRAKTLRLGLATAVGAGLLGAGGVTTSAGAAGQGQCAFGIVGRAPIGAGGVLAAAYQGPQTAGGVAQQCSFRVTDDNGGVNYTVDTPNPWDIRVTDRFNQTRVVRAHRDAPYVSPGRIVQPEELVAGPVGNGDFVVAPGDRVTATIYTTCAADQCAATGFMTFRE